MPEFSDSNSNLNKKLGLGTVQFGLDYGISNLEGQTPKEEVKKILEVATKAGIDILDTAFDYGKSEEVLGDFLQLYPNMKVVSKFPTPDMGKCVSDYLEKSLQRLRIKSLYGYLAHHSNLVLQNPDLWKELNLLKQRNLISKIGYSLYTPAELERLLDLNMIPDIIQVPFNVFDRRFAPHFPLLQKLGVEIHTRSAFLQGLFFVDADSLPSFFDPVKAYLKEIRKGYSSISDLSGALLYFCASSPFVAKVIVGVNNVKQLRQNLESLASPQKKVDWNKFQLSEESILLPSNWPQTVK